MTFYFSIFFIITPLLAKDSVLTLTLNEAFQKALQSSHDIRIQESKTEELAASILHARSPFYPDLTFQVTHDRLLYDRTRASQTTGGFNIKQSLFSGGKDWAVLQQANLEWKAAQHLNHYLKEDIFKKLSDVFFSLLSSQAELENLKQATALAKRRLGTIQKRARIGQSNRVEQLATESQSLLLESELASTLGTYQKNWVQFQAFTQTTGDIVLTEPNFPLKLRLGIDAQLAELQERGDIVSARRLADSAVMKKSIARAGFLPELSLQANYYLYSRPKPETWDARILLSIPLFSGLSTESDVRIAAEQSTQSELIFQKSLLEARSNLMTLYETAKTHMDQVTLLEQALVVSKAYYEGQENNYQYGQATNLEVIQAFQNYLDTKRSYDRIRIETRKLITQLDPEPFL